MAELPPVDPELPEFPDAPDVAVLDEEAFPALPESPPLPPVALDELPLDAFAEPVWPEVEPPALRPGEEDELPDFAPVDESVFVLELPPLPAAPEFPPVVDEVLLASPVLPVAPVFPELPEVAADPQLTS